MTELERFHACMAYRAVDRTPFWDWGAWPETIERWKSEGYDPEKDRLAEGADRRLWFGTWFRPNPPFVHEIREETDDHVVYVNHEGILLDDLEQADLENQLGLRVVLGSYDLAETLGGLVLPSNESARGHSGFDVKHPYIASHQMEI